MTGYKLVSELIRDSIQSNPFKTDNVTICMARCHNNDMAGVCGGWSYDFKTKTCSLHHVKTCCGQKHNRVQSCSSVMGYRCPFCWSTDGECPTNCDLTNIPTGLFTSGGRRPETQSSTVSTIIYFLKVFLFLFTIHFRLYSLL